MNLVNTDLFRTSALHFLKHGYYTDAPEGTKDWSDFWDEEVNRFNNGYSVGGVKITGRHYFYLNYTRILRVNNSFDVTGQRKAVKTESFPAFWDGDYNYFWTIDIAQNGISQEEYDKLDLDVEIKHLEGGKHLIVVKARGLGFSYKGGSMCTQNLVIGRNQKTYTVAEEKEFLIRDGLLNKAWDNLAFVNDHTAFAQPLLKDTDMHKWTGYKKVTRTGDVVMGTQNQLIGVTIKNDPDKIRGKRGVMVLFEEAGKCPGLLRAWEICRPSFEQGAFTTGLMIAFGTGGTEEANYEGLQKLFEDPDAYNCLALENIWDEGATGTSCGYFAPAYQNWEGYMDADGNSDIEGARAYLEEEREKKKKTRDPGALDQYIAEHPFTPREATLQTNINLFPIAELSMQYGKVISHKKWAGAPSGILLRDNDRVVFRPEPSRRPIIKFPLNSRDDTRGLVTIYEAPVRIGGEVPQGLYIIGHDPYAHDKAVGGSLGATYVIKRANPLSHTYPDCIVASWVGRPATQDEYNEQLFLLSEYYQAKIGFENDRGELIPYAKRFKKLQYLQEEFMMLDKKELQSVNVRRNFGMHMTPGRKQQGEIYIRDWLNTKLSYSETEEKKILHTITDPALLQELMYYNDKGNFDRVMALMVAIYHLKEMDGAKVAVATKSRHSEFFQREFFPTVL